jgi:hypothetical protein
MKMRDKLKFKKLLNEFRSLRFEGEYIEDILLEAHDDFENYYSKFCEDRGISIKDLEDRNKKRVETIKGETVKEYYQKLHGDSEELVQFKKTHRKLMRMLHPDKLSENDPMREEKEEDFKKVVSATESGIWADFFDVADKYGVEIEEVEEANRLLMEDIEKMVEKNKGKKTTFSWMLNECEDEPCRERIIKTFLNYMYGYDGE